MIRYIKYCMLKTLIPFLFTFFLSLNVHAEDASEKISGYISNLIPGEGVTSTDSVYTIVAKRLKRDGTVDDKDVCTMTLASTGAFTDC